MNRMLIADAPQRALAFLTTQAMRIEREVYQVRYADIQYPQLIPVDTQGPEWISGVTYFSSDIVGVAKWFTGKADDVPHADVLREKFETTVSMAAIGYDYDLEELGKAQLLGMDLRSDKASGARRAAEEFVDRVAITGAPEKGYYGIANHPSVTAGSVAANGNENGATNSTEWDDKTPEQILEDVNAILMGQFTNTYGAEIADTLLLPYSQLLRIATRKINDYSEMTVLQWILENNVLTRIRGQQLTVSGAFGLETAGAGGTARMIAYRRAPEVLKLHMPMPFRFLNPWQQGPIRFEVPGIFRIGGVDVRRPKAMRYADGI